MKRSYMKFASMMLAVLSIAFTACNQGVTAGNGTGEVRIVLEGGAARAADPATGLPVLDGSNTKITVTGEDGTQLAQGTTSITLQVAAGKKITVKAVVTAAAGQWRGSAEHTVTEGTNTVAVKLSKAPNSVGNILIDVVEQNPKYKQVKFKLAGGKELVSKALIGINPRDQEYLVTARDSIGRIYVLYKEGPFGGAALHFKRYDTEGNEDAGFETAIKGILQGFAIGRIKTMTVDPKTGTIFVAVLTTPTDIYAVTENGHNTFTCSNSVDLATLPDIETNDTLTAMAAYNGELFLTVQRNRNPPVTKPNKLFACTAALSGTTLTLTEKGAAELDELRTSAVMNVPTGCTGLFADESGVYCLLSEQNLDSGNLYALGQIVRYQYSGSAFTGDTEIGLNPKAAGTDGIPFDAQYFSAPVGFIGYDEENIYIADDGGNIQDINENWRITGNKNRIAAFNRKTNEITFTDTDATWYAEFPNYEKPNTKVLLWEKNVNGMYYWTSTDGTDDFSSGVNAIFENTPDVKPTDQFCYDQDGNLYILWKYRLNYKVRRFPVKMDGSYDKTAVQNLTIGSIGSVTGIAVDISDGKNYLYYADTNSSPHTVKRFKWGHSSHENFTDAAADTSYTITLSSGKATALAVNRDGVFAAVKEEYVDDNSFPRYRLKVEKYAKSGSPTAPDEITLVDNAPRLTNTSGNAISQNPPSSIPYKEIDERIDGLQVVDGALYAITSRITKTMKGIKCDAFRSDGTLYRVGKTDTFSGKAQQLAEKKAVDTAGEEVGYGFYRFIAVKPQKLVIASDGAWGMNAASYPPTTTKNTDKVLEYDLEGHLQNGENGKKAGGSFSKELTADTNSFSWE